MQEMKRMQRKPPHPTCHRGLDLDSTGATDPSTNTFANPKISTAVDTPPVATTHAPFEHLLPDTPPVDDSSPADSSSPLSTDTPIHPTTLADDSIESRLDSRLRADRISQSHIISAQTNDNERRHIESTMSQREDLSLIHI